MKVGRGGVDGLPRQEMRFAQVIAAFINIGFGFQAVELLDVVFEKSGCRDGYCQRPNIITRFSSKLASPRVE